MENNYIYVPDGKLRNSSSFRCRVPMQGTLQQFIAEGTLSGAEDSSVLRFVEDAAGGRKRFVCNVPKGCCPEEMLQLIAIRNNPSNPELDYSVAVNMEESSSASILLCSHTMTHDYYVTSGDMDVVLSDNSSLNLVLMQNEHNHARHVSRIKVAMGRNARLNMVLVSLHGGDLENSVRVDMNGEGGECRIGGLYLMDRDQKYVADIRLNHNVPHCHSDQIFKGILDAYFGEVPETFTYNGKTYTPQSYAQSLNLDLDNYVALTSFTHHPFYSPFVLEVPDNWCFGLYMNIPLDELKAVIDNSLNNGHAILWAADVSEDGFNFRRGYALMPKEKTEAYQANHNLLVSDQAKVDTQPQLEIYADDVKCSHGATIGRMDEQSLFYMRSRGIALKEARILQQLAFVHEVLERVEKTELKERLASLVERRLRGEFSDCRDCSKNCC